MNRRPGGDPPLDLVWLATAVVVAEAGSVRLAAGRLHASAPAVSRRLRALEERLGVSLFERRSTGMRPTEAGSYLLESADRLLRELDAAAGRAREAGTAAVGRVVVGTYFSASAGRLRHALVRFLHEHDGLQLVMIEDDREELLRALRGGRADVAVLLGPSDEPGLERMALWEEAGMVALPDGHRLAARPLVPWGELAAETFIVTRRGSGREIRLKVETQLPTGPAAWFAEHDVGREAMFNLVSVGLGVAVLAESASGASYPGVVFRPVGNDDGVTTVEAAAYWDPKRDNPALRRFLAHLRVAARDASGG